MRGQALGLQKNLVAFLVGKAVDFVFHARAIARAHAVDLAGEHGAAVEPRTDDVVCAFVGMRDVARHLLWVGNLAAHKTEDRHWPGSAAGHTIARLFNALAEVNRATVNAWRRAGFQSALR